MPDNIIQFPPHPATATEKAQSQRDADQKATALERARAKSMRQKLADRPMIQKESDRMRVAKNLWLILNDMKSKGYKPSRLLRDIGRAKNATDSTKQLRTYALAEHATHESHSKQIKVLARKGSLYLDIAERAAKIVGSDVDLIVLRLFENTSYQVSDDITDEKIAAMQQVCQLLIGMGEAAIRGADLANYLEILKSRRIGWDVDGSFGDFHSLAADIYFRDRAARHVSYLGYAPTVFLCKRHVGPLTPIEGEAFQIDFEKEPDAVNRLLLDGKPLPIKYRMPVSLSIYREIWFGIGPMATAYDWEPIFEKRLSFRISGNHGNRSLDVSSYDPMIVHEARTGGIVHTSNVDAKIWPHRVPWLHQFTLLPRRPNGASLSISVSPHIDTSESISHEDVQREHLEHRWLIRLNPFEEEALSVDKDIEAAKGQFYYEAVDLASCTKYLDQVADPDDWDEFESECFGVTLNDRLWNGEDETEAWYQDFSLEGRPAAHVASPIGSIARAIEQNILREDADNRLDAVLFETVAERVQAANKHYRWVLQKHDDRLIALLSTWKQT